MKRSTVVQRCNCCHFGPCSGSSSREALVKRTDLLTPRSRGAWKGCAVVSGSSSGCYPNGVRVAPRHALQHPLCSPPRAAAVGPASQRQSSGCAASRPFLHSSPGQLNRLGGGFWSQVNICIETSHFVWKHQGFAQ